MRAAGLALALSFAANGTVHAQAAAGQRFTVVRSGPDAEIRFQGLTLKAAKSDPANNQIILEFDGAADRSVFDRLETALPGWVDTAYAGYDSAVIRAARPVTFMTRSERGGFAVRMMPRGGRANAAHLRGQIDAHGGNVALAGMQRDDRSGAFALRGSDYGGHRHGRAVIVAMRQQPLAAIQGLERKPAEVRRGGTVAVAGRWRHPEHGRLVESDVKAAIPVYRGLKLVGSAHDVDAEGSAVRRLDGTTPALNKNTISASAGVAFDLHGLTGPGEVRGEALWGASGWGGRLAYAERARHGYWGASVAYRAPYNDTLEAVADRGYRSRFAIDLAGGLADGLWAEAVLHGAQYGVDGDNNVAQTLGADASLRYLADLGGVWGGLTYEFDGDYVLSSHKYLGLAPRPFTPMAIRTFEVHAFSGSLTTELFRGLWADLYAGYAIDRYAPDGYFGGGDLRYAFAPGWALTMGGGYSQVSTRQGETGAVTSAGLNLVFDWGAAARGAPARPVSRAYFSSL
jgi:hypothetical protein